MYGRFASFTALMLASAVSVTAQTKPTLTIAASAATSVYGSQVTFTATISSGPTGNLTFYNGSTSLGTGTISGTTATLATSALTAGTHSITVSWAGNTTYTAIASSAITQTVTKATPAITWAVPAPISSGTALSSTQLNATATPTGGTFVYSPVAGTVLADGSQTLSATYTPTDTTDYTTVSATTVLTVGEYGTVNTIPMFTGSATLGNSAITETTRNVTRIGIGTTAPSGVLDVTGGVGGFAVAGQNLNPVYDFPLTPFANSSKLLEGSNRSAGGGEIDLIANRGSGSTGGFNFYDYTNDGSLNLLTTIQGNGYVGIGTASPLSPLSVSGQIVIGTPYRGDASLQILQPYGCCGRFTQMSPSTPSSNVLNLMASTDSTNTGQWFSWGVNAGVWQINPGEGLGSAFNISGSGQVGIGTATPAYPLDVTGQIRSTGGIVFPDGSVQNTAYTQIAGGSNAITQTNGKVGIGTTTPSQLLTVQSGSLTFDNYGFESSLRSPLNNFTNLFLGGALLDNNNGTYTTATDGGSDYFAAIRMDNTGGNLGAINFYTAPSIGGNSYTITNAQLAGYQRMTIVGNNVGIGTATPAATLEVNGTVKLDGSTTYPDGSVQSVAWNGILSGGDYAESVDVTGERTAYEPGDVLIVDPNEDGKFLKSAQSYSTEVTGVYSTRPGVLGRRQKTDKANIKSEVPMAMTGIVPIKVSTENGPIRRGDLLVTSSTPGVAMRGTDRFKMLGAVIGKSLGHLDDGIGTIEAVITLQ